MGGGRIMLFEWAVWALGGVADSTMGIGNLVVILHRLVHRSLTRFFIHYLFSYYLLIFIYSLFFVPLWPQFCASFSRMLLCWSSQICCWPFWYLLPLFCSKLSWLHVYLEWWWLCEIPGCIWNWTVLWNGACSLEWNLRPEQLFAYGSSLELTFFYSVCTCIYYYTLYVFRDISVTSNCDVCRSSHIPLKFSLSSGLSE